MSSTPCHKLGVSEKGRPLPKFGEWDVNDPASAEGFTVIFNKARDEKKTGGKPDSPSKTDGNRKEGEEPLKPQTKKWFCCMQSPHAES
ncbi:protein NOI4 isoform X1 [Solanum lycopersicum]|uniref:protein NOI4 isoform X1 n=1 Tax=Solanum lycopersicum TaxID=4081 RepID=UPI0008FED386|nr:protein NOI4 isoform X1 [Solanum lycopersicum]